MFTRWGAFVYRFRRPVALLSLLVALAAVPFASGASGELSSGGWLDPCGRTRSPPAGTCARLRRRSSGPSNCGSFTE